MNGTRKRIGNLLTESEIYHIKNKNNRTKAIVLKRYTAYIL